MNRKPALRSAPQRASVSLAFGRHSGLSATVRVTNGGLLAIAALVSAVLLSTAVLVRTAVKDGARSLDP